MGPSEPPQPGLVIIATVRDADQGPTKLQEALRKAGIKPVILGSLGTRGVWVPESDRERALEIVREDSVQRHYYARLHP